MIRLSCLVLTILVWSSSVLAQSAFVDDFNRPDGDIGNGWSVWGNPNTTLVGGELRTFGAPRVAGGVARTLPASFPLSFSFDFRTLNPGIDPYNDSGWFIAFNAANAAYDSAAQLKFYQFAGSLSIRRETSNGVVDAQPNFSGPVRGWQDFTAAPAHIAGSVNADLSASIFITYSNGSRVSVSFGPASASPQGAFFLVGNSNGSNGPHIIDNISVGPQTLLRTGTFAQIASGAGWKTAITLINSSSATSTARIDFHANDGTPLSLPLSFPQSGSTMTSSFANVTIAPNASLVIETEATTSSISVGWADVRATSSLSGYSIFRLRSPGVPDSEGTVPLDTGASPSQIMPYDNTKGYRTGLALANGTANIVNVVMLLTDQNGVPVSSSQISLSGFGHASFFISDLVPQSANQLGMIQLLNVAGVVTGIGLRFSPSGSFTSVPFVQ
jgi:hypothetical protein